MQTGMNSIGGYFELELRKGEEYHKNAIHLNTGRNALELILKVKKYKKVYIPYYTCDAILEPFQKTKVPYEFYNIDKNFEPVFDYSALKPDNGFLYINYFGLKDSFIFKLSAKCKNLIVDNSQAFFSKPIKNVPTFYSCRKFFGVPDGAYLYLDGISDSDFPLDCSEKRFSHLLKRICEGAEAGFNDFKINENSLIGQPIRQMSKLTKALLCNIDYAFVEKKRRENYLFFQKNISKLNKLKISLSKETVPMVYPFLADKKNFEKRLIEKKVFVANYWNNVLDWSGKKWLEYKFAKQIIPLPIDQRYDEINLSIIIKIIK